MYNNRKMIEDIVEVILRSIEGEFKIYLKQ